MRVISILTLATALLGAVSALTVPVRRSGFDTLDTLERRAKHATPNPIKFSGGAKAHLDRLGLDKGSAERKAVKDYHRNIVAGEMAKNGVASARIVHLGHTTGSVDSRLHITAGFWDQDNKRMKSYYGDPPKKGDLHHVYADHVPVDPTYKTHVEAKGKSL